MKLSFSYSKGSRSAITTTTPLTPTTTLFLQFLTAKGVFVGFLNYKSAHHLRKRQRDPQPLRCTHPVLAGRVQPPRRHAR